MTDKELPNVASDRKANVCVYVDLADAAGDRLLKFLKRDAGSAVDAAAKCIDFLYNVLGDGRRAVRDKHAENVLMA